MQVNRPSNIPGIGQGPLSTDRSNRDGQRRQQDGKPQGEQRPKGDAVELHAPEEGTLPAARPMVPKPTGQATGKQPQPPLDLSA